MTRTLLRAGLTLLLLTLPLAVAWAGDVQHVALKQAVVRAEPRLFARKVATLAYGDQVEVTGSRHAWRSVRLADGRRGWLQQAALSGDDLQLTAGKSPVSAGASDEELTLAGKGFNREVEAEFKKRNGTIDYRWVDRMEGFAPSDRELQGFLANGKLRTAGGD